MVWPIRTALRFVVARSRRVYMAERSVSGGLPRRASALLASAAIVAAFVPGALGAPSTGVTRASIDPALAHLRGTVGVIVQTTGHAGSAAESAVTRFGGRITHELPIISGFAAKLPARAVQKLSEVTGVRAITLDGKLHVQASSPS